MNEIGGKEEIKDREIAMKILGNKENLLKCTPNVKKIDGNKFTAEMKMGPLQIELEGEIKDFQVLNNEVKNVIEVSGPGIIITINTNVRVEDKYVEWNASYDVRGPLSNAIRKTIDSKAKEVTKEIISCTLSLINVSNNS